MSKVWGAHTSGYTSENVGPSTAVDLPAKDGIEKGFTGATRRDRTGDLLITNQPLYQLS